MAHPRKQEVVTFKVDASLSEAMRGIPNRSAFIRAVPWNSRKDLRGERL